MLLLRLKAGVENLTGGKPGSVGERVQAGQAVRRVGEPTGSSAGVIHQRDGKPGQVAGVIQGTGRPGQLPVQHPGDPPVAPPEQVPRPEVPVLHRLPRAGRPFGELPPRIRGARIPPQGSPQPLGQPTQLLRAFVGQDLGDERPALVTPLDKSQDFPAG